jgi:isopentenyl diphosphate isomerase/L-lactate dehydrogenase-like FMN-dependent dehydrogenase
VTARRNEEAFHTRCLVPRVLQDVSSVDTTSTVLGQHVAAPVGVAPVPRLTRVHADGERAVSAAAAEAGLVFCAATNGSIALEELAAGPCVSASC